MRAHLRLSARGPAPRGGRVAVCAGKSRRGDAGAADAGTPRSPGTERTREEEREQLREGGAEAR